jgi:carboxyl-terminal processing protease
MLEGKVGYLKIADLSAPEGPAQDGPGCTQGEGATRLLLDLRGCVRGDVEDAVRVAGLFVPQGPVVSIQERGGAKVSRDTKTPQVWTLPVYVLGNGGTAGGVEVLAAALRARLKSTLLGETTYGWGSEQEMVALPSGDGLILSSSRYLSPSGEVWNKSGLKPDKEITSTIEERAGLEPDTQLKKALDIVRPAAPAPAAAKAA